LILEKVPPASSDESTFKPLRAQPFNLAYDNFLGRLAICRIYEGQVRKNDEVYIKGLLREPRKAKIIK